MTTAANLVLAVWAAGKRTLVSVDSSSQIPCTIFLMITDNMCLNTWYQVSFPIVSLCPCLSSTRRSQTLWMLACSLNYKGIFSTVWSCGRLEYSGTRFRILRLCVPFRRTLAIPLCNYQRRHRFCRWLQRHLEPSKVACQQLQQMTSDHPISLHAGLKPCHLFFMPRAAEYYLLLAQFLGLFCHGSGPREWDNTWNAW